MLPGSSPRFMRPELAADDSLRQLRPIQPSTPRELRDHAMVAILICSGLRRAELYAT
jgi:site-specific recombinase XerC